MRTTVAQKVATKITRTSGGRVVMSLALIAGGMLAGSALQPGAARGDVKDAAQPQSFQTGDQLALPVLKDIANTLHQMDARLSKMEAIAQQWKAKQAATPGQK